MSASSGDFHDLESPGSPTQIVCTGLVYSTVREGQDGRLCDISSNSCVKLWFMDLVRSLFQVQDNFLSKFKDRSRSESSLFCCEQRHSDIARIVKHLYQ